MLQVIVSALTVFYCSSTMSAGAELSVDNVVVQRAEDGPPVSADFHFQAGSYVYCTFYISGFQSRTVGVPQDELRRIDLAYTASAVDGSGRLLAPAVEGTVRDELTAEDKNWTPKRRASFQLPSFIAAGTYKLRIEAKDALARNSTAVREMDFQVGGETVAPSASLSVGEIHFYRSENDREPLETAAYSAGDPALVRFRITGFTLGSENRYRVSYRATVLGPNGKPYLRDPLESLAEDKTFYPAPFIPGEVNLTTAKNSRTGSYTLLIRVHDEIGDHAAEVRTTFTIE